MLFQITLSGREDVTLSQMEQVWSSLQGLSKPVVFEIIGDGSKQKIIFQFLCHPEDKTQVANQLLSIFPGSLINLPGEDHDYLTGEFGDDYR